MSRQIYNPSGQKRILVAASMNAGAEAVSPVAKKLNGMHNNKVYVLSHKAGIVSFKGMKIDPMHLQKVSMKDCENAFNAFGPTSLLTGTQVQDKEGELTFEQMLWRVARDRGIKSIAVMDTWENHTERFSDLKPLNDGNKLTVRKGSELVHLPDKIAVLDEFAKKQMLEEGFEPGIIEVTGSPYYEHVLKEAENLAPATRKQFLERPIFSGFSKDAKTIVFMSDNIEGFYPDIGFTEKSVLQSFLKTVDGIAKQTGMKLNIIVRPHPFRNENAKGAYECETNNIVKVFHNPITAKGFDPDNFYSMEELLYSVDLVVGTFNNPLITAKLMGKPVISYQPNLNEEYNFQYYLHEQGLVTKVTEEKTLGEAVTGLLNGGIVQRTMEAARGATDRIIELLK